MNDIIKFGLTSIISKGLVFVIVVFLAHAMTKENFGIFAFYQNAFGIILLLGQLGLPVFVIRTVSSHLKDNSALKGVVLFSAILSAAIPSMIAFAYLRFLDDHGLMAIGVFLVAINTLLLSLNVTQAAILNGFGQVFGGYWPNSILRHCVFLALAITLHFIMQKTMRVQEALLLLVAGNCTACVYYLWRLFRTLRSRFSCVKPKLFPKRWSREIIVIGASSLTTLLNSRIDIVMIDYYCNPENVAVYNVGLQFVALFSLPVIISNAFMVRKVSALYAQERLMKLAGVYMTSTLAVFLTTTTIVFTFLLFGKIAWPIIFPKEYESAHLIAVVFAFGYWVIAGLGPVTTVLYGTNNEAKVVQASLVSGLINMVGNIVLIPRYAELGAAVSTVLSVTILSAIMYREVCLLVGAGRVVDTAIVMRSAKLLRRIMRTARSRAFGLLLGR